MGTDYLVKRVAERTDSSPEQVEKMRWQQRKQSLEQRK